MHCEDIASDLPSGYLLSLVLLMMLAGCTNDCIFALFWLMGLTHIWTNNECNAIDINIQVIDLTWMYGKWLPAWCVYHRSIEVILRFRCAVVEMYWVWGEGGELAVSRKYSCEDPYSDLWSEVIVLKYLWKPRTYWPPSSVFTNY